MRVYASTLNFVKSRRRKSLRRHIEGGNLKCGFREWVWGVRKEIGASKNKKVQVDLGNWRIVRRAFDEAYVWFLSCKLWNESVNQ